MAQVKEKSIERYGFWVRKGVELTYLPGSSIRGEREQFLRLISRVEESAELPWRTMNVPILP